MTAGSLMMLQKEMRWNRLFRTHAVKQGWDIIVYMASIGALKPIIVACHFRSIKQKKHPDWASDNPTDEYLMNPGSMCGWHTNSKDYLVMRPQKSAMSTN